MSGILAYDVLANFDVSHTMVNGVSLISGERMDLLQSNVSKSADAPPRRLYFFSPV